MPTTSQILLVEDDECSRELLEDLLREEGYTLASAKNGVEAKELLKKNNFSLLVTDFKMPGLDGVELLKWCKLNGVDSAVLFMTAVSGFSPEEASALHMAKATFIQKPMNLDNFLKKVRQLVGRREIENFDLMAT